MAREDMKWSHKLAGTQAADPLQAKLDHYRSVFALALEGMNDVWAGDAGPKFWKALDALEKGQP